MKTIRIEEQTNQIRYPMVIDGIARCQVRTAIRSWEPLAWHSAAELEADVAVLQKLLEAFRGAGS